MARLRAVLNLSDRSRGRRGEAGGSDDAEQRSVGNRAGTVERCQTSPRQTRRHTDTAAVTPSTMCPPPSRGVSPRLRLRRGRRRQAVVRAVRRLLHRATRPEPDSVPVMGACCRSQWQPTRRSLSLESVSFSLTERQLMPPEATSGRAKEPSASLDVSDLGDTTSKCKEPPRSPPPGPRDGRRREMKLLAALRKDSVEDVRTVLEADPDETRTHVSDSYFAGPALCAAVYLGCCPKMIELLLAHGADANSPDAQGRSPFVILCSIPSFRSELAEGTRFSDISEKMERRSISIATKLLRAGALTHAKDAEGRSAKHVALSVGNRHLANLIF